MLCGVLSLTVVPSINTSAVTMTLRVPQHVTTDELMVFM